LRQGWSLDARDVLVLVDSTMSLAGSDHFYNPYTGKGQVLFTGPDGNSNFRSTVLGPSRYIGIGDMSPEGTSELSYLWRPSKTASHPLSRSFKVGEIGWHVNSNMDKKLLQNGHQILLGEFRQLLEDRQTHLYQSPWTPHPNSRHYLINKYGREISRTKEEQSLIDAKSADIPYSRHASALSRASKPGGSPAKNSSYKIRRVSNSTTSSHDSYNLLAED